jgi:hypothetical protein
MTGPTAILPGRSETEGEADEYFNTVHIGLSGISHADGSDKSSQKAYDLDVDMVEPLMLTPPSAAGLPDSPPVC